MGVTRSRWDLWPDEPAGAFYHARVTVHGQSLPEVMFDLDWERLQTRILLPYQAGTDLMVNGRLVGAGELFRVQISRSPVPAAELRRALRGMALALGEPDVTAGPAGDAYVAAYADDLTNQLITAPPGGWTG